MPRMPFEESRTSRPTTTAYLDHQDWRLNSSEPKNMDSREQEPKGHELDHGKPKIQDLGASHLDLVLLLRDIPCATRPPRHH
jgi:hypothetical protein